MITPLGGKTSLGTSPIIIAEQAAFQEYKVALLALFPINTEERAAEYRKLVAKFMPGVEDKLKKQNRHEKK